ncbi:SGNH/GDSL hydrolase family protein [Streptomyces sp. NPDC032940]|uniref:SGNH/GDSL hydrolase family protein n=1 Tax=Streptomyces sp. NPDC032940 TaxID=3155366 RepID=UPI0033F4D8A4
MTQGHDGGVGAPPSKQRALLTAIVALIVAISAAIYATVASDDGTRNHPPVAGGRLPHNDAEPASTGTWVGAWATSPVGPEPGTTAQGMAGRSVRNVVRAGAGGTGARITLSNLYGRSPLTITHASIALAADDGTAAAAAGSMRRLTFGGSTQVVVPAGGQVKSDVARIAVPYGGDVLITTYSPVPSGPVTYHPHARQTSYVAEGDRAEDVAADAYTGKTSYWRYVTALDVLSHEAVGTVVALGDSITDGYGSTMDADHRWTDFLTERLRTAAGAGQNVPRYSVVNEGISSNRLLTSGPGTPPANPSTLSRFPRDVLGRTGARTVVVAIGVNDILHSPELADRDSILAGLRTLVDMAHAHGLTVVGGTVMPFGGHSGYTDAREQMRQEINEEIREGRVFDAVADFDAALRDPYAPRRLAPEYDSGDHLHPSDNGYARMATALDLTDLRATTPATL